MFGGDFAAFVLKYPKLTGITPKITNPTLHLREQVCCKLAFLVLLAVIQCDPKQLKIVMFF
jgi:hypothetical protein